MKNTSRQRKSAGFFAAEAGTVTLLGLAFGVLMLDRGAVGFLAPFFVGELHLTHAQLGVAASATSVTWALAGFPVARVADRAGRHKACLVAALLCFSMISACCGLATGFVSLLAIRLGLGLAEGPVPPLTAAILLSASAEHRRGLNMGILSFFRSLIAIVLAPLLLVGLASRLGWRPTFLLSAVPGILVAIAVAHWLKDQPAHHSTASSAEAPIPVRDLLRNRNVIICACIGVPLLAFAVVNTVFLPLYLVKVRHLSPMDMGSVMAVFGGSGLLSAWLLPTLSDRLGRRWALSLFAACGVVLPLGCLTWTGGTMGFAAICAIGALGNNLMHMAAGMIAPESVSPKNRAAATALVSGIGELLGGFVTPSLAGLLADRAGLGAALALGGACTAGAALLALCLTETAPRLRKPAVTAQSVLEAA